MKRKYLFSACCWPEVAHTRMAGMATRSSPRHPLVVAGALSMVQSDRN